jgi:hypothetical protein
LEEQKKQEEEFKKFYNSENSKKGLQKIHSLYFPFHWKEAVLDMARLYMYDGEIQSVENLEKISEKLEIINEEGEVMLDRIQKHDQLIQKYVFSPNYNSMFHELNGIV